MMTTRSLFKRGQQVFFHYKCFESEESADAELWHHTDQHAVVVKRIFNCEESEVGQMYIVRFSDGFEYDVFADEMYKNEKLCMAMERQRRTKNIKWTSTLHFTRNTTNDKTRAR